MRHHYDQRTKRSAPDSCRRAFVSVTEAESTRFGRGPKRRYGGGSRTRPNPRGVKGAPSRAIEYPLSGRP